MIILAVGAHPDDVEFGCAPLLMQEADRGHAVRILVLSRGEAGTAGMPEQREDESRAAAKLMGATIEFLDFRGDCHLVYSPENAIRLAGAIRMYQPAIVLAPHPEANQHPDHAVTGRLMRDACRFARYAGLAELRPADAHTISSLFFYQITRHGQGAPDLVIDIGPVMARWEAVMRCHSSQLAARNYLALQTTATRLLGLSVGCEHALGLYANDPIRVEALSDLRLSSRSF